MISRKMAAHELEEIALRLEDYDALFSQLWQLGRPEFTDRLPTAAVSFDPAGQVILLHINPKYWAARTPVQKDFLVCHEMLHVVLEHGRRAKDAATVARDVINIAMDVVVNELLCSGFGFDRKKVDPKNNYCWLDTVFSDPSKIEKGRTFEYYLSKLVEDAKSSGGSGGTNHGGPGKGEIMDDHSSLPDGDSVSKMAEEVLSKMSPEEQQQFEDKTGEEGQAVQAGTEQGGFFETMKKMRVPRKRKWETLIKKYLKKLEGEGTSEVWFGVNRRFASVQSRNAILPVEIDHDGLEDKRALVYLFLDTSGSCQHLAARFWKLALSIPRDRFDVQFRCFDTKVYNVNPKDRKLFGFGGTSFDILEKHIQKEREGKKKYPDGVFIITDGYGNHIVPEKPERWHVLLTTNSDVNRSCFPDNCDFHSLEDFE